jgi:NAD(P)-dependent dehydrogenase (short-subunit alcohol dehydrogenase family)
MAFMELPTGVAVVTGASGGMGAATARGEDFATAQRMVEAPANGRMGHPDELAAVAVFLCSPAASFVTAVDWLVDGGHTAAMGF